MNKADAVYVAQALVDSRLRAKTCEFTEGFRGRPRTEAEGYEIEREHLTLLQQRFGGGISGYKAGFITPETRRQFGGMERLGIDWPTYGGILSKFTFIETASVPFRDFIRPSVECELAVRIGEDIPVRAKGYDRRTIAPYIEAFMPAMELVDFHIPFNSFSPPLAPLMLADNACNWGVVVGAPFTGWRELDLESLKGDLLQDGRLIESGRGAALAGHPLEVVVEAQSKLSSMGKGLRGGEILMLGSVVLNFQVTSPCEIIARWEALGDARFVVT